MRHFGWDLNQVFGRLYWRCPYVEGPCTMGTSYWCGACIGQDAIPHISGLTTPLLQQLFMTVMQHKVEEVKIIGGFLGASFEDDADPDKTPEEIAMRANDPLYDFPHDVRFYTPAEVEKFRERSKVVFEKNIAGKLPLTERQKNALWDEVRYQAALGDDLAAKRAAQVDPLWVKYTDWKKEHGHCSLDRVRWFIEIDIARSKLYPLASIPEQQKLLKERWEYEDKNGLPRTVVSPDLSPPQWYLDHLRKKGTLVDYMGGVDRVMTRKVDDG